MNDRADVLRVSNLKGFPSEVKPSTQFEIKFSLDVVSLYELPLLINNGLIMNIQVY